MVYSSWNIIWNLLTEHQNGLFQLDKESGEIFLTKTLPQTSISSYLLTVVVYDTAQHSDSIDIIVLVTDESGSTSSHVQPRQTTDLPIILGASLAATAAVILFGSVAYVKVLKQVGETRLSSDIFSILCNMKHWS